MPRVTQQLEQPCEPERQPSVKLANSLDILKKITRARLRKDREKEQQLLEQLAKIDKA